MLCVLDIIIGVPSLQAHNLDAKIREERCRYLVAELVCRVRMFERLITDLCSEFYSNFNFVSRTNMIGSVRDSHKIM